VDTAGLPPIPADTSANALPTSTVPEPVSTVLIGTGLAAMAAFRKRRRRD
jgi:hypothetical protein